MKHIAPVMARGLQFGFALALSAMSSTAFAADQVYPPGVRIGMVPLVGLVPSRTFAGFEASDQSVKVLMTELPTAAFAEVETAFKGAVVSPTGIKPESIDTEAGKSYYTAETARDANTSVRRYSMVVPGGTFTGYVAVQVPENATRIYTDEAVRKMFASVTVRKEVPLDEQLALMPFKITELGSFPTVRTLAPGAAILLSDTGDEGALEASSFMVIGSVTSAPEKPDDRGRFAQQAAASIPGLRDARITMSEPVRIDGSPGFETRVDAISGKDNTPVTVVQWLRFGGANVAMRIIASTPRTEWTKSFPRFRAVRDGIQPR